MDLCVFFLVLSLICAVYVVRYKNDKNRQKKVPGCYKYGLGDVEYILLEIDQPLKS